MFSQLRSCFVLSTFVILRIAASDILANSSGVYDSSTTPSDLPWNTYNYCNSPHVNEAHYVLPVNDTSAQLVYVNAVIRHHKRTPCNLYPDENALNPPAGWDCSNFNQQMYVGGAADLQRETFNPTWHPFASTIWNGTCDEGQLTQEGLLDAVKHGKDFWSVYNKRLGFLTSVNTRDIHMRVSTELRTDQVASGLLFGMDPETAKTSFPVHCQPANIDSIPPDYPCPNADAIRAAYQAIPAWNDHIIANQGLFDRLAGITGVEGMEAWSFWYDHFFDTFTSRTCHGHPLPCNTTTGVCVSEEDARTVFSIGDFEYNYIWSAADNASTYVKLTFGVFFQELLMNFKAFQSKQETFKMKFYVGHDGSMIRLESGLGMGKTESLRWPGLGSEIVMEVWRTRQNADFVRVMHEGTPVQSLQWVPIADFISLLEGEIPENLFQACMGT